MNRTILIRRIIIIAGVLVLVGAIVVFSLLNAPAEEDPVDTPSGTSTISPSAPPSPTPTLTPNAEDNKGNGDALGQETNTFDGVKADYFRVTNEFLVQYLHWDSAESPEDRAARIAPYVAADSPLLTRVPGISLVDENAIYDYTSQASVTRIDDRYTQWASPDDAVGNQLFTAAMGNYKIAQQGSAGTLNTYWEASGRWVVQFADWEGQSNPVVIDVREPDYLGR